MDWLELATKKMRSRSETCYETGGEVTQKKLYLYLNIESDHLEQYLHEQHVYDVRLCRSTPYNSKSKPNKVYLTSNSLRSRDEVGSHDSDLKRGCSKFKC